MRFRLLLILLLVGCSPIGGRRYNETLLTKVEEGFRSGVESGNAYMFWLPWILGGIALAVFLIAWYTPDTRDNIPGTIISFVLGSLSLALAVNGERMALNAEKGFYITAGVGIIAGALFYTKGWFLKKYPHIQKTKNGDT